MRGNYFIGKAGLAGNLASNHAVSAGGNNPINPDIAKVCHGKAIRARLAARPRAIIVAAREAGIKNGIL